MGQQVITVGSPTVTRTGREARWSVSVDSPGSPDSLWYTVPAAHAELLSDRADAALIGLLLPAMRTGRALRVSGTVTDELLHSVRGPLQAYVRSVLPMYGHVTVTADGSEGAASRPAGVATGFSAGIDSFSALGDYLFDEDLPGALRVTHLLFNNVGSHSSGDKLAKARLSGIRDLSAGWDVSLVDFDSNLDDHFLGIGTNTAFMNTHTFRNATVAHLLSGGIGTWYYASGYAFRDLHGGPSPTTASSDVISLPLMSTGALRLQSVGSERTRVQKTLQVATMSSARKGLDVCIDGDPDRERNCSSCWKCQQTMITLDLAGELDAFCPARFDRDLYERHRDEYMATVLSRGHAHDVEIINYAAAVGFTWPRRSRLVAAASRGKAAALSGAREVRKRIRR